jgi:hypothetical protein
MPQSFPEIESEMPNAFARHVPENFRELNPAYWIDKRIVLDAVG